MRPRQKRDTRRVQNHSALHGWMVSEFVCQMTSIPVDVKLKFSFLLKNGEWKRIIDGAEELTKEALLSHASFSADAYFERAQLTALAKKYRGIDPRTQSLSPEQTARRTWLDAESLCRDTTLALCEPLTPEITSVLQKARHYIWTVLGDEPPMDQVYEACSFSSGASVGVHGDLTHIARKVASEVWTVTLGALPYALSALRRSRWVREQDGFDQLPPALPLADVERKIRVVPGNKLTFVPKTMATHRAIAVEPLLNSYVQSGVDAVMRRRLVERCGNDLRDQSLNQKLAREGSVTGSLATIDLSSASDTLSCGLIKRLLPYGWWRLLSAIRSPKSLDVESGAWVDLWKFSSMGNNFTFPLQTLVFLALSKALGSERARVYGDDIIVEAELAPSLCDYLGRFGMLVNWNKSFYEGPFRESCGSDWWHGSSVRAIYCVKSWSDITAIATFYNRAKQCWPDRFLPILDELLERVDRSLGKPAFRRPVVLPDGGAFNVELDQFMAFPLARWRRDLMTWEWPEYYDRPVHDRKGYGAEGDWALWLSTLKNGVATQLVHRRKTTKAIRYSTGSDLSQIPRDGWEAWWFSRTAKA